VFEYQRPAVEEHDVRPAFQAVLDELIDIRGRLREAQTTSHFAHDFLLPAFERDTHRHLLDTHASRRTRRLVGTAYVNVETVNRLAESRENNGSEIQPEDQIDEVIEIVNEAIWAMQQELDSLGS
jgi:hypothetical protein